MTEAIRPTESETPERLTQEVIEDLRKIKHHFPVTLDDNGGLAWFLKQLKSSRIQELYHFSSMALIGPEAIGVERDEWDQDGWYKFLKMIKTQTGIVKDRDDS